MRQIAPSSKFEPLQFFVSFCNRRTFSLIRDNFYSPKLPINPSFESHIGEGYISYIKDYSEGMESPLKRVYFKDYVDNLIDLEKLKSMRLLKERNNHLLYSNSKSDSFLERQLIIIGNLKIEVLKLNLEGDKLMLSLNDIEDYINKLLKGITPKKLKFQQQITSNTFFKIKKEIKRKQLIELYYLSLELEIFDMDVVSEEKFLDVFMTNNPDSIEPIQFICNNLIAVQYLSSIKIAFDDLGHSRISQSKLFFSKGGKLLNQSDFDNAKSRLVKSGKLNSTVVSEEVNKFFDKNLS